jgi:tetratricopeptide (TPR) repeat protein
MNPKSVNRPPGMPTPSAGLWTKLMADSIEVGLSQAERESPAIRAALEYFEENRTAHRVLAGETASKKSWTETVAHLETLILEPAWMPLHGNPRSSIGPVLRDAFIKWEHFAAQTTICPNLGGALTRAALRGMIALFGVMMGIGLRLSAPPALKFRPWRPKAGLGLVMDSLRRRMNPPLTRLALCEQLRLTTGTWDRLRRGIVPAKAAFDFGLFTQLISASEEERQATEFSLRRAFAGARLVASMEKNFRVGGGRRKFWADCWAEFERVFLIAAAHPAAPGGRPSNMRDVFLSVAKEAKGHWSYVWRAAQGEDRHYFGLICASLLALSSWNRGKPRKDRIRATDATVLFMLDQSRESPALQTFLLACDVSGSPEAMQLLQTMPATTLRAGALAGEHVRRGEIQAARAIYEAGFAAMPDEWLARYQLAWFESSHGDPNRALVLLADTALSVHHEYHAVQGKAYFELGNHAAALAAFEKAISRQDSLLLCYALKARCARALGQNAKAKAYEKNWRRLRGPVVGEKE